MNLSDSVTDGTDDATVKDESISDNALHHNAQLAAGLTSDLDVMRLSVIAADLL